MFRLLAAAVIAITVGTPCLASDIPTTNWGAVLKVPVDKVEEVDKGLIAWGNWIKETHPLTNFLCFWRTFMKTLQKCFFKKHAGR